MRRAQQMGWRGEHQSSGEAAFASFRSRAARSTSVLLVLAAVHTLSWVGCGGGDDTAPVVGQGDGDGDRDGSTDAGDDGGEAADAAPDADFGFEELDVPDAAADSGTDSRVPDQPDEFACGEERWGDGAH